jgi:hypothetical protein
MDEIVSKSMLSPSWSHGIQDTQVLVSWTYTCVCLKTFEHILFTKCSTVDLFPSPHCSPFSSTSCSLWCLPYASFSVWYCFLLACLGNHIFLVGVRMKTCKYSIALVSWKWETQNSFKFSSLLPCELTCFPIWTCTSSQKSLVVTNSSPYFSFLLCFY